MTENSNGFDQWGILELMGHVRLAGRITEESHFGAALGRIDIPNGDGFTTQYFGGGSIYRLTPTTEDIARSVAQHNQPQPVSRWELPVRVPETAAPTPYDPDWTSPLDEEIDDDDSDDEDEEEDEDAEEDERKHELSKEP